MLPFELPLEKQLLLLQEQLITGLTGLCGAKTGSTRRHQRLLRVWRTLQQESLRKPQRRKHTKIYVAMRDVSDYSFAIVVTIHNPHEPGLCASLFT